MPIRNGTVPTPPHPFSTIRVVLGTYRSGDVDILEFSTWCFRSKIGLGRSGDDGMDEGSGRVTDSSAHSSYPTLNNDVGRDDLAVTSSGSIHSYREDAYRPPRDAAAPTVGESVVVVDGRSASAAEGRTGVPSTAAVGVAPAIAMQLSAAAAVAPTEARATTGNPFDADSAPSLVRSVSDKLRALVATETDVAAPESHPVRAGLFFGRRAARHARPCEHIAVAHRRPRRAGSTAATLPLHRSLAVAGGELCGEVCVRVAEMEVHNGSGDAVQPIGH